MPQLTAYNKHYSPSRFYCTSSPIKTKRILPPICLRFIDLEAEGASSDENFSAEIVAPDSPEEYLASSLAYFDKSKDGIIVKIGNVYKGSPVPLLLQICKSRKAVAH